MRRIRHTVIPAILAAVLSAISCNREQAPARQDAELMVSLYIPGAKMTKAETGTVSPLAEELKMSSLQIWAFLSDAPAGAAPISYRSFTSGLELTGLSNATVTRFGLPLTDEVFAQLTTENRPTVDVYVLANAASATTAVLDQNTPRSTLDQVILNGIGGNSPLTTSVPDTGLPMSGVKKSATVSGGYPVLNISSVKLTRGVSKIRFVFCQQGIPSSGTRLNEECAIMGISFDGTAGGNDCQVSTTERLFTERSFDLGPSPEYTPLSASINGTAGAPLIPNGKLSLVEEPELLFFRGEGNETESAEHYEQRLDQAVAADSQVGPIYLRETDKRISGTITYRISKAGGNQTARFRMDPSDVFSRNHTWIIFACFVEETMKLEFSVVVLPWEWEDYPIDYTTGSVNVIRRFGVAETTPATFIKRQTQDGFFDVWFWDSLEDQEEPNSIEGDIIIATPVGGKLHIIPVPGAEEGCQLIPDAIVVDKEWATIYPNYLNPESGRIEDCRIPVWISCNRGSHTDEELEGNYIDLHFCVEINGRFIDLGSESIDYYRFRLSKEWWKN